MSRRKLVGVLVSLPVIVVCILFEWHDLRDLPFWSAWSDWRHSPGLLALTAVACFATFVLSSCALHVGCGRWAKVIGLITLLALVPCGLGALGGYALSRYQWSHAVGRQGGIERAFAYEHVVLVAMSAGLAVFIGGSAVLILALAVRTWTHRKEIFPFLYRGSGPDRS